MDRSDVIYLIAETFTQNDFGGVIKTETPRRVFCNVSSVTRAEWSDGGRLGLNPEYRFTMFFYDYSGEEILEYNGIRYTVYRTYRAQDDTIELYAERRQGNE
jgi:hypothetical protein